MSGLGFRVQGLGFRVWGLGFRGIWKSRLQTGGSGLEMYVF